MARDAAEAELVRRLRARDEDAFRELMGLWRDRVFALTYRMLGDRAEAEDLAQEVFVTIFRAIPSFRGESALGTWILRITANHCRNRIKYNARRHQRMKQPIEDTRDGDLLAARGGTSSRRPDHIAEGNELERIIQEGLRTLDADQREALVLRDMEHMSYQEIAEVTGVAQGTVKSRLFRARLALRDHIEARYGGSRDE